MTDPTEINSVYWNAEKKSWEHKMIRKPLSHNIKTGGEFKVVYVECGCARLQSR